MNAALVLLAHGSPDPDWRAPLERVVQVIRATDPAVVVELAFMDFIAPSLQEVVTQLAAQGSTRIRVVAAFLSAGGRHLKRDVPKLVAEVAASHPDIEVTLVPGALGDAPQVIDALAHAAISRGRDANT